MEPAREGYGENSTNQPPNSTMITIIQIAVCALFFTILKIWLFPTPATNRGWAQLVDDSIGDDIVGTDEEGLCDFKAADNIRGTRYKRVCGQVAKAVKAKMGLPSRTAANKLVAWELADKELTRMGVRASHRPRFITVAVALVFIPTEHDILAAEIGRSIEVMERENAVEGNHTTNWLRRWFVGTPALAGN